MSHFMYIIQLKKYFDEREKIKDPKPPKPFSFKHFVYQFCKKKVKFI